MRFMSRCFMGILCLILVFGSVACERTDKAFETLEKAKNLKTELEKKAEDVKKDITGKAEELGAKVKKSADDLVGQTGRKEISSENKEKPQQEKKERKEQKDEKD